MVALTLKMPKKMIREDQRRRRDEVFTHFLFSVLFEAEDMWPAVNLERQAREWARRARQEPNLALLVHDVLSRRADYGLDHVAIEFIQDADDLEMAVSTRVDPWTTRR